jgi:hypothetical protein
VTIILILGTRRFALPPLGAACLGVVAVVGALAIITTESKTTADATLRFALASPPAVSIVERMIADNGGGTFGALLPVYRH